MDPVREKLTPKFKLRRQEDGCLDMARLSKVDPRVASVQMSGGPLQSAHEIEQKARAFKWFLGNETHDREFLSGMRRDMTAQPLLIQKESNPLLVTDTWDTSETVEEKIHRDDVARAQLVAEERTLPPQDMKPLSRLFVAALSMGGLFLILYLISKNK